METLLELGAKVYCIILYNFKTDHGWLSEIRHHKNLYPVFCDIRDTGSFSGIFENDIDYIFHLASLIGIPYSYSASISYVETNITGTLNILNSIKNKEKKPRMIYISSSEVYGSAQYTPMDENHPLNPQSPYAASKVSAEYLIRSYIHSFDIEAMIIRPFNTFGERQSPRAVIPTIILQALGGNTVRLGNTHTYRDFNYIMDTIYGLVLSPVSFRNLEIINIGRGYMVSISDIIDIISALLNKKLDIKVEEHRVRHSKTEVIKLMSDISKAKNILNYSPLISFDEGIHRTLLWLKKNASDFIIEKYYK